MELELDILSSLTIQRKKPWSSFCWLEECEPPHGLYIFSDGGRMSQLSLSSGKTKRKFSTLSSIQKRIVLTVSTPSGSHMGGILSEGDLFVWDKANNNLSTFVTPLSQMENKKIDDSLLKDTHLFLSSSGKRGLLVTNRLELYLWECREHSSLWWVLMPPSGVQLPKPENKEGTVDAAFYTHTVLGDCCTCVFAFTLSSQTVLTTLLINWPSATLQLYNQHLTMSPCGNELVTSPFVSNRDMSKYEFASNETERTEKLQAYDEHSGKSVLLNIANVSNLEPSRDADESTKQSVNQDPECTHFDQISSQDCVKPFQTSWRTVTRHIRANFTPDMSLLSERGSYVLRLSPSCSLGVLAVNCNCAVDTELVFFSPLANAELGVPVYSSKVVGLTGRTFWLADMSWTADGLFVVCVTKRGSMFMVPRCGPPSRLSVRGCSIEMGPRQFLPLHPLIVVTGSSRQVTDHAMSESSEKDVLRQRFSVATHPHLPIILCSDGYSLTVLKLPTLSLLPLISNLIYYARSFLKLPLTEKSEYSDSAQLLEHQSVSFRQIAASFSEDKESDATLASTIGSASALGGMDEGGLHFAGLGSTLEFSTSVDNTSFQLETAVAYLVCAWGLVLTCGLSMAGDGVSKVANTIDSNLSNIHSSHIEMSNCTKLLTQSVLDAFKILHENKDFGSEVINLRTFVDIFFNLLPLNSIAQSQLDTAATLANGLLVAKLTKLYQSFLPPVGVEKMETKAFVDYINSMSTNLSEISDILDSITAMIEQTYGLGPLNSDSNCFYAPCFIKNRIENQLSVTISALCPASSLLSQVLQRLHQDVSTREEVVKKHISSTIADSKLQDRKMSDLYNELSECLNNALVTIQYASTQVRWTTSNQEEKRGNPITSKLPKPNKVSNLISLLEHYDVQGAFKYVHSLINYKPAVSSHFIASKLSKQIKSAVLILCHTMTWYFCEETPSIKLYSESHVLQGITLSRKRLSKSVQSEYLSQFWTVDHNLELLVASQHWSEACLFLQKIRDWKKTFLLTTVVVHHSRLIGLCETEYVGLKDLLYQLALEKVLSSVGLKLSPVQGSEISRVTCLSGLGDTHLQQQDMIKFVSDVLTVCAHVQMDLVLLNSVCTIMGELNYCIDKLSLEVPSAVYLPAPPLFCPQPAISKEELVQCSLEYKLRNKVSHLIRSLAAIFTTSHTYLACASWYCHKLEELHKSGPSLCVPGQNLCSLPLGLANLAKQCGVLDFRLEGCDAMKVMLGAFRELCGMLWFLHARDQLSMYLRLLQPSPLKESASDSVIQNASLWSARLFHFASLLGQSHISGTTLTILSELETNMFLVEMLAYCFPFNSQSQANVDKLDRILSRLRSTAGPDSSPFSVHYQSKSQIVITQRHNLGANLGQFYKLVSMNGSSYVVKDDALQVGSFLFEYDSNYIQFIDEVFSILFPEEGRDCIPSCRNGKLLSVDNLSSGMQLSNNVCSISPLLSYFLCNSEQKQEKTDQSCWEKVLPLLQFIQAWIPSAVPPTLSSVHVSRRKSRSKSPVNEPVNDNMPSLKVNLSPNVVVKCLQQREDHMRKLQNSSTLEVYSETRSVVKKSNSRDNEADDNEESQSCANLSVSGPPLLFQLPPGTLKGRISGANVKCEDLSTSHLKVLDLTTEDPNTHSDTSTSHGELPSALTFSVGEKKSRANNAVTAKNDSLGDTLTDLSETATLTFKDLVLPLESSPNDATLNNSTVNEPMPVSSSTTAPLTAIDAIDMYSDHNMTTKSVGILENNSGSVDTDTFSVTLSDTLSQSLPCSTLNSTLQHTSQRDVSPKADVDHQESVVVQKEVTKENVSITLQVDSCSPEIDEKNSCSPVLSMKTEIRDILKLQQQELLTMLKTMEAKTTHEVVKSVNCGTQIDFDDESFLPQGLLLAAAKETRSEQRSIIHTPPEEESQDDTMPILNLEDLRTASENSHSNSIPPPTEEDTLSAKPVPNPSVRRQDQCIQTEDSGSVSLSKKMLCNKNGSGMIPHNILLSTTSTSTVHKNLQARLDKFEQPLASTPKKSKASIPAPTLGQLSQISRVKNDLPLLQSKEPQQNGTFEAMYPDFARNLNSMKCQNTLTLGTNVTGENPVLTTFSHAKPTSRSHRPLLLKVPDMSTQQVVLQSSQPYCKPPVASSPQKITSRSSVSSPHPSNNSHQSRISHPLFLSYNSHPQHRHTHYSIHGSQPSGSCAPNSSGPNYPPFSVSFQHQCPPYQLPTCTHSSMINKRPPLLSVPVQPTFRPIVLHSMAPTNPPVPVCQQNQQRPYQLSNVPVMPFVPTLIPQPEKPVSSKKVSPPLLQAIDPIRSKEQNGLKLLKEEPPKLINPLEILTPKNTASSAIKDVNWDQSSFPLDVTGSKGVTHYSVNTPKPDSSFHIDVQIQKHRKPKKPKVAWTGKGDTPIIQQSLPSKQTKTTTQVSPELLKSHVTIKQPDVLEVQVKNPEQTESFAISMQEATFQKTPKHTVCEQDKKIEPQRASPIPKESYYPDDIPLRSLATRRLDLQSQFGYTLSTPSSPTTVVSEVSDVSSVTKDKSLTDVTLCLSQNSSVAEQYSPSVHSSISIVSTTNVPKSNASELNNPRLSVLNEVYHPPVLALNIDKSINQDQLSVSALSSTFTVTPHSVSTLPKGMKYAMHDTEQDSHDIEGSIPSPSTLSNEELNRTSRKSTPKKDLDHLLVTDKHIPFEKLPVGALSSSGTEGVTALNRLLVLEDQLNAIESTVKTVQGEFKSSKQILRTIDKLQNVSNSGVSDASSMPDSDVCSSLEDVFSSFTPRLANVLMRDFSESNDVDRVQLHDQQKVSMPIKLKARKETSRAINKRVGSSWRRKDLQQWMKAKREERMAIFREHRNDLLKSEKHPFKPTKLTTATQHSLKQEKLRRQEHVAKRFDDAFELMQDMLTAQPVMTYKPSPASSPMKCVHPTDLKAAKTNLPCGVYSNARPEVNKKPQDSDNTYLLGTYTKKHKASVIPSSTPKKLCQSTSPARKLSSVHGLTEKEQMQIANILESTFYDGSSVSSGSVLTNIDWEEVDKILDS